MVKQAMKTPVATAEHATGVLPSQAIRALIGEGAIAFTSTVGKASKAANRRGGQLDLDQVLMENRF